MNFLDRLKYWWTFAEKHPFVYNRETAEGIKPLGYYPFSDRVRVRFSEFGLVNGSINGDFYPREQFERIYTNPANKPLEN